MKNFVNDHLFFPQWEATLPYSLRPEGLLSARVRLKMILEEFLEKEEITAEDVRDIVDSVSRKELIDYVVKNFSENQIVKFPKRFGDLFYKKSIFKKYGLNYANPDEKDRNVLMILTMRLLSGKGIY